MILSRVRTPRGFALGIGLAASDVVRLRRGLPIGFPLSAVGLTGDASGERVLVAYARPDQLVAMQNGYFPLMADARIVLILSDAMLDRAGAGAALQMETPGAPVELSVVFFGETADDVSRAFFRAGLLVSDRRLAVPSLTAYGPPVAVVPTR